MRVRQYWASLDAGKQAVCLAFLGSLLLSVMAFLSDPVINRDGMLYIDIARNIAYQGGDPGRFNWPYFSYFLAGVFWVSPFSDVLTTMVVIALFSAAASSLLVVLLTRVTAEKYYWLAVMVALAFPGFNENRALILRDWPAWFFSLGAIYSLIRLEESGARRYLLFGLALLFLGVLCRLEVAALGGALGLAWALAQGWKRVLLLGSCFLAAAVAVWFSFGGDFGDRINLYVEALNLVERYQTFMDTAEDFAGEFLHPYSQEYGGAVLFWGLFSIIPMQFFPLLGPLALTLVMGKGGISSREKRIYLTVFVVWTAVLTLFLTLFFLLSSRYVVLLALLAMPWLLTKLVASYEQWSGKWRFAALFVLVVTMIAGASSSSGYKKFYMLEAGDWLSSQPPALYFNDPRISFYAGQEYFVSPMEEPVAPPSGALLVWLLDRDELAAFVDARRVGFEQERVFDTGGDDVVLVLSVR